MVEVKKLKKIKLKSEYIIIAVLSVAIIFILFNSSSGVKKTSGTLTETEKYVQNLENELEKTLIKVSGVKKVKVMITVDGGIYSELAENKVETEENGVKTVSSTPIILGGKTVVLRIKYPEILGVVIVCKGVDDYKIKEEILYATMTALNISSNKVQILAQ